MNIQEMQEARFQMMNNVLDAIIEAVRKDLDKEFIESLRKQLMILSS
jgi:hypothetical protein